MKNTIYTLLTAGAICTNAWAAGSQSWHVYDITDPIAVTTEWEIRATMNLEIDDEADPFTIFAMGEEVGLETINNNFELLFDPGDGTFLLNYCTANGTETASWGHGETGKLIRGAITESGTYTVTFQGGPYFGQPGRTGLYVAKGADLSGNNSDYLVSGTNWWAEFTFADGTVIDTISSQADIIEMKGAELRAVPEPTTATLSLLALAGLVARRRRK